MVDGERDRAHALGREPVPFDQRRRASARRWRPRCASGGSSGRRRPCDTRARRGRRTRAAPRAGGRRPSSPRAVEETGGSITLSGKCTASSASSSSSRRSGSGCSAASDIAAIRPGIVARRAVARDDGRRQPVGGVDCDRRDEDAIAQRADACERAAELARVCLGSAAQSRDERQQADADHAGAARNYGSARAARFDRSRASDASWFSSAARVWSPSSVKTSAARAKP